MTHDKSLLSDDVLKILQDVERRAALDESNMMGSKRKPAFDEIARKAALVFDAPVAQINFLDEREQVSNVSRGFDGKRMPVELSFCAHALEQAEPPLIVLDTLKDERFAQNPFVADDPDVRFYAGCPIRNRSQKIGMLCVMDYKPRKTVGRDQRRLMIDLAWNASLLIDPDQIRQ